MKQIPNCALAQKSVGKKKILLRNDSTNVKSKHYTKHYLYLLLCNRFNVAQRLVYGKFAIKFSINLIKGTNDE